MTQALKQFGLVFVETATDTLYLSLFFFVTYLILEYLEHHTKSQLYKALQKTSRFGPLWGMLAGITGGCGFSAVASNFYMARAISFGTLICIYLVTSDEMLPLLISEGVAFKVIAAILAFKMGFAMCAGFLIDFFMQQKQKEKLVFNELCKQENCQCKHDNIVKAAVVHTMRLMLFVFIISLVINCFIGQADILYMAKQAVAHNSCTIFFTALVGLIPSCSVSIGLTKLYIQGIMPIGALMAGLFSNAGVGLIVLYKLRPDMKEMLKIIGLLFVAGVIGGHLAGFFTGA